MKCQYCSKTLILGAHEAVPCAPELGHINGPKTNKIKNSYGQNWIETDQNWRKNQETDRSGQKQTKIYKKRKGNGKFSNLRF